KDPKKENVKPSRARFTFIRNSIDLKPFKSGIVVEENNLSTVAEIMKPHIIDTVDINRIIAKPKEYWEKVIKDVHSLSKSPDLGHLVPQNP
ncbi:MAG: hypothetical protein Q8L64_01180, partial [bacterium]|nr:hypothetical protein [bacterium]